MKRKPKRKHTTQQVHLPDFQLGDQGHWAPYCEDTMPAGGFSITAPLWCSYGIWVGTEHRVYRGDKK
jgi:hypothetical protein